MKYQLFQNFFLFFEIYHLSLQKQYILLVMQTTTTTEQVLLSLPDVDLGFLRALSKKMGWQMKRQRKSGLEKALDDVKAGRVYEAKSVDDLLDQLNK